MKASDLEKLRANRFYYWDKTAYLRKKKFIENYLCHFEGEWVGQPFKLLDWQDEWVAEFYGWKERETGLRKYRSGSIWIPKGGGKSEFMAALGVDACRNDDEPAAEVYIGAANIDQAEVTYNKIFQMIKNSPRLVEDFEEAYGNILYKRKIKSPATGQDIEDICKIATVSSEGFSFHGKSPHFAGLDELWAQKDSKLFTAMMSSRRSRRQPIFLTISTAGEDRNEFAKSRFIADKKLAKNPSADPSRLVKIYAADPEDDWQDEKTWAKANPSLGITPKLNTMRDEYRMAKGDARLEKDFKQFRLNLWVGSSSAWIRKEDWDKGHEHFNEDELVGLPCYLGCDLSITTDFTALALVFKKDNVFYLVVKFYMPLEMITKNSFIDQMPYDQWAKDGWITPCGRSEIDQKELESDIIDLFNKFNFPKAIFDAALASSLMNRLDGRLPYIGTFPQTFRGFGHAAPFFHKVVAEGRLKHNNPVLDWMAENVEVAQSGNFIKPVKPSGERGRNMRIDGIVASIMALSPFRDGDSEPDKGYEAGMIFTL